VGRTSYFGQDVPHAVVEYGLSRLWRGRNIRERRFKVFKLEASVWIQIESSGPSASLAKLSDFISIKQGEIFQMWGFCC